MSKKHFIALADAIKTANADPNFPHFDARQIETLANFCRFSNPMFNRERWLAYIAGTCGPNGGAR
jgi:hypothetical protein